MSRRPFGPFRGVETTESGELRMSEVPSESESEPRSPNTARVGFGVLVRIAQILGLFGASLWRFSGISWS